MRIKLDDTYILESDQYNVWVSAKRVSHTGKERMENVTGYYRRIEDLLDDYIDRKVLASKATSLSALKKDIAAIKKQVSEWKNVLTLNDINEIKPEKKKPRKVSRKKKEA